MKTVTQNFVDAQKSPSPVMVRQLWYKRRYWVESSKSYTWETNWTQLTEDKVFEVSDITGQLDVTTLNEFKTSNVTLKLENLRNQWSTTNPYGVFAKDSTSPVFGYLPYWTKFQVRVGLQFGSTPTTEVVPVFTGVATDYNVDNVSGAMQITLTGEEALVIAASAEAVSTTVTNETATGTVDGSNKNFTTAHNGVGIFMDVSDNGLSKRAGADFTISQLNDPSNPGKVTFSVAPLSGHTIRFTYFYWNATQKFETLVAALLTQAGISGGNQQVSPVVFPGNVINTHVWQTQADWNGGTVLTLIDAATIPNSIQYLYSGASTKNDATTGWTDFRMGGDSTSTFSSDSTGIFFQAGAVQVALHGAYFSNTFVVGDSITSFQEASANTGDFGSTTVIFMAGSIHNSSFPTDVPGLWDGYGVNINYGRISSNTFSLSLTRYDSSGRNVATLASSGNIIRSLGTTHQLRIRRNPSGLMRVYMDGVLQITATDATYTSSSYFGIFASLNQNQVIHFLKSTLSLPTSNTNPASWISAALDFGATPTAYSQFQYSQTLNNGATIYYTNASADNVTYDGWVAVPANGQIASTLRRYLKVRVDIDITNGDPVVQSITAGSITSSTSISLANFTGMTCYDAITALAKFANYEFGFDANEKFFFRPKNPGNTPVFTLAANTFNTELVSQVPGYDRVFSKIRASYAGYIKDITDDGLTHEGPLPSFGYNMQTIDGGSILISSDADVASGLVSSFFAYYRLPRRRVKVRTKIIPQLDISDVISVSFQDLFPTQWYIGDTSTYIGDTSKSLYGPEEQILPPVNMKVVGFRIDTNNWITEFDLEEVI